MTLPFAGWSAMVVWLACSVAVVGAPSTHELQVIALSGSSPRGAVLAGDFVRFDAAPVINNVADVAFLAGPQATAGEPFAGSTGVWVHRSARMELVASRVQNEARSGLLDPITFQRFSDVLLNDRGDVAFQANLAPAANGSAIDSLWIDTGNSLQVVAHSGMVAPGMPAGTTFEKFVTVPALSDDGSLAFHSFTRADRPGANRVAGLWVGDGTSVEVVAHAGGPAIPGDPETSFHPQSFEIPFGYHPVIANGRFTMFQGFLRGPEITTENGLGLWQSDTQTGRQMTVISGIPGEGTDGDPFLSFPNVPGINRHGQFLFTAFFGRLDTIGGPLGQGSGGGGGTGAGDDEERLSLGVWSNRSGAIEPIMRLGDAASGAGEDATFVDFTRPIMNEAGAMAFHGFASGAGIDDRNEFGIWSEGLTGWGDLTLVARMGDWAPGAADGVIFQTFQELAMNSRGQLAFMANVSGPGVSDAEGNVIGLWAEDRSGSLHLVARTGDSLEVGPGDERVIASILFAANSGGDDGRAIGLNDLGRIAFQATFTDGTAGIFVSNVVAVPEPSSVFLISIGFAVWFSNRRKRRRGFRFVSLSPLSFHDSIQRCSIPTGLFSASREVI